MTRLLCIALGGALGALLRHACVQAGARWAAAGVPLAILAVNVAGSLVAGAAAGAVLARPDSGPNLRAFAVVGVLGAFTTFSAFSVENLELWRAGMPGRAVLHALLHVTLSIAAAAAGLLATRSL